MTSQQGFKKRVRAYMEEHDMGYMEARREMLKRPMDSADLPPDVDEALEGGPRP